MNPHTKEKAFEDAIERSLTTQGGWTKGDPKAYDRERALQPEDFLAFLAASQPEVWKQLGKEHGKDLEPALLEALVKALDSRGTLDVLRHGLKLQGKKLEAACFRPSHGLNPDNQARYRTNRLVLTRQVHFNPQGDESVDLLLALNGLPIATAELKNSLTGQSVEDAVAQYRRRDPRLPLFRFKARALVHFAVDPQAVRMTTRLAGEDTRFLPFDRGRDGGAGNPPHPSGYPSAHLWDEVLARDSFLDLVARFLHVKKVETESIVFPRYHQLQAVRSLEAAAREQGPGASYLVQHSAGSGKSNTIGWLAHRLASLFDAKDVKVFGSVIVITDRRVLDKQLQDTIYQLEHRSGVVECIREDSTQLAAALTREVPIIITTLQKFPFVTQRIAGLAKRSYAVLVDEAHSSQGGETAREMKEVLAGDPDAPEPETADDRIRQVLETRGKQKNLSFFAFTATPKPRTLEVFGHKDAAGKPIPFHLYSMRQAIEEGFILDVLRSYTTYKAFYGLVKKVSDDPEVPKRDAVRQLARFMSLHPHNLAQKTQVMVEHFRSCVMPRIGGKAKAMLVASSRLHAVRYKQAFDRYLGEKGYQDMGVLVAFSGTVTDPDSGLEYTEPGMNKDAAGRSIPESRLVEEFDSDAWRLLLVAEKYQTGFDQPLLHTMYVDKKLAGVHAVQTLSRLNRIAPGKQETLVLDFVNEAEAIREAFQPFYEATSLAETADPQQLYDLQHELDGMQVYWASEVEGFAEVFFKPPAKRSDDDHAALNRWLAPPIDRFRKLDETVQQTFRDKLVAYVALYGYLSQIMPFGDPDLEKRYALLRALGTALPKDPRREVPRLEGDVALRYYRLAKIAEATIQLKEGGAAPLYGPTAVGTRKAKDEAAKLSEIIQVLNDKFGTDFTEVDQLLFDQFVAAAREDESVVQRARANPLDNFSLSMRQTIEDLMVDRHDENQAIVTRYLNDKAFQETAFRLLVKRIYEEIRGDS